MALRAFPLLTTLVLSTLAGATFAQVQGKCVYNCGTPNVPARSTGSAAGFDPSSFGSRVFDAVFEAGQRAAQRRREEQALQEQLVEQQRQAEEQARREEEARQYAEAERRAVALKRDLRPIPDSAPGAINIGSLRLRNVLDQAEQAAAYGERARQAPSNEAAAADARQVFDTPVQQRLPVPALPQPPEVQPPSAAVGEVNRQMEQNSAQMQTLWSEIEQLRRDRTPENMMVESQKRDEFERLEQQQTFLRFRKNQIVEMETQRAGSR